MFYREDLEASTRPAIEERVIATEKNGFEGYEIMEYKQVVWGIAEFVATDTTTYLSESENARKLAYEKLLSSAKNLSANAVINVTFEISKTGKVTEVTACGNAVVIEPIKNYIPSGEFGLMITEMANSYLKNAKEKGNDDKSILGLYS